MDETLIPDLGRLRELADRLMEAATLGARLPIVECTELASGIGKLVDWLTLSASQSPPADLTDIKKVREQMASFEIATKAWLWHALRRALAELEKLRALSTDDLKPVVLALLSMEQLRRSAEDPTVAEADKVDVRKEIERRGVK